MEFKLWTKGVGYYPSPPPLPPTPASAHTVKVVSLEEQLGLEDWIDPQNLAQEVAEGKRARRARDAEGKRKRPKTRISERPQKIQKTESNKIENGQNHNEKSAATVIEHSGVDNEVVLKKGLNDSVEDAVGQQAGEGPKGQISEEVKNNKEKLFQKIEKPNEPEGQDGEEAPKESQKNKSAKEKCSSQNKNESCSHDSAKRKNPNDQAQQVIFHTPDSGKAGPSGVGARSHPAGIDDGEADFAYEPSSYGYEEDPFDEPPYEAFDDQQLAEEGPAKKMRLYKKTPPSQAPGFPSRELLKKVEFCIRQNQLKKAKAKYESELKAVRCRAVELLARQPPSGAIADDEWKVHGPINNPHRSHRILTLHGNSETIFCKRCACWSSKTKLRHLAAPCQGLKVGSKSTLRLPECGVMPSIGATIPAHLKKRHGRRGRRCRW